DEEDVSADRRDREACRDTRVRGALADLVAEARAPEPGADAALVDAGGLPLPRRDLGGCLAAKRRDLTVEIADPCLARVLGDEEPQSLVRELDPLGIEPVRLELLGDEIALG